MKLILDTLQIDVNTASELTGFAMSVISMSVFIGLLLYDAFDGLCSLLRDILHLICGFLEKRFKFFRTSGKRKGGDQHVEKSGP